MAVQNKNLEVSPGVQGVWIDVKDYFALGLGAIDEQSYIEDADAAAVAAGLWLFFSPGSYRISDDMTLSAHCWFAEGAMLNIDAGKTVTFDADSKLTAGLYQIFSGSGAVAFTTGSLVERAYPQWWGATADRVTDDTVAIQAGVDATKNYRNPIPLFFPKGDYYISAAITIDRRVDLSGTGFGSQIFQSADENMFVFEPYATAACNTSRISGFYLGSAAVTAGKSMIYLHKTGNCIIEHLVMEGAPYNIHIHGSLHNIFQNLRHQHPGFFETCSPQQIAIYVAPDGTSHSNGNMYINCSLGYGTYGLYVDETNEGNFHWSGGRIEQACEFGVYVGYAHNWSIHDIHMEGSATCGITIEGCSKGRLLGKNFQKLVIKGSREISILGGSYDSINTDRWSKNILITNTLNGGAAVIESSTTTANHMALASGNYQSVPGKSNRSERNHIDGDFEVWSGGAPIGWTNVGTGNLNAIETSIVRFGSSSAKVEVGAGQTVAVLRYDMDVTRYVKKDLTTYRSSAYKWTASGSGANEYYVELAAGGDPDIRGKPELFGTFGGLLVNDVWATEGSMGSLAAGEWDYGDNDSLGYNTIYLRLSDDTDPDTKSPGYVQGRHRVFPFTVSCWVYKPETNGGDPWLTFYYGPPGAGDGGRYTIPFDEWTRISRTFFPRSGKTYGRIYIGFFPGVAGNICYVDGVEIVDGDSASPIYDDSRGINGDFRVGGRTLASAFASFTANDATPNVSAGNNFETANAAGTTITRFDGGAEGQEIFVKIADGNTTIDFTGTNLKGNGGVDWSPASGDHLRCKFDGTDWWCDIGDNTP